MSDNTKLIEVINDAENAIAKAINELKANGTSSNSKLEVAIVPLNIDLNAIFENLEVTVRATPSRLDPLADLQRHSVRIPYSPRFGKTAVPFMDFTKGDRRYLDYLIEELTMVADVYQEDKVVMLAYANAKRSAGGKQTWQQFVDELHRDKTLTGKDYSEGQLKHLPALVDLLRAGKRLAGCGSLEFYNVNTGDTL